MKQFYNFLKSPGIFKIPYCVFVLILGFYFLYIMGNGASSSSFFIRFLSFLAIVAISYFIWLKKNGSKR